MKVVTAVQMGQLESMAYRNGSTESDFMEEAGRGIADWVHKYCEKNNLVKHIVLLCGRGNNAGDAYVAGRYLLGRKYRVYAFQIGLFKECSPLTQKNYSRFLDKGGIAHEVNRTEEISLPKEPGIILDGLFGTGFHGVAKEPYASVIKLANKSEIPTIAIDIPSGLNGNTGVVDGPAIKAVETIFLGLPKVGFFLQDGWNHVGKLRHVDFGLPHNYIDEFQEDMIMLSPDMIHSMLPKITNNRHKYQTGFVVGLGGSPGMPGAAIMTAFSTLRGGAGIVRLLHPKGMESELSNSPYEVIRVPFDYHDDAKVFYTLNSATANFIGPGMGKSSEAAELLEKILPKLTRPCVIDADGLNIIAEEKLTPPPNSILTPHTGEMTRLLHDSSPQQGTTDFLKSCQKYAEDNRVTLVQKGGPTFIFHPDEPIRVNIHSDPGMATAGTGDILTGVITAMLAQGLPPHQAASLGVYLHGLAGELAAEEMTSYSMVATDLLTYLPKAFKQV